MFKQAERKHVKIKGVLTGPAGSGKTFSALTLATGMGGKIALIDTEGGKSQLYANDFDFQVVEIRPPYTVAKYRDAIKGAVLGGFDTLIIDSISHEWAGDGGILRQVETLEATGRNKNKMAPWAKMTPQQELFVGEIVNSNIHILATMRSKTAWIIEENSKGKQAPRKVGMAPVQRDGIDYEFFFMLDLDGGHFATKSKDQTHCFSDEPFMVKESHGEMLVKWANTGKELTEQELKEKKEKPIREQRTGVILNKARELTKGKTKEEKAMWMNTYLMVSKFGDLSFKTIEEMAKIIESLEQLEERTRLAQNNLSADDVPF